ncbi:MAG TPA: rhomboid family intramembrane serine protease [Terriglobia bacterium]|nr:rhomboid family intramembrane serine protease [Terriglobia bacterium]
MGVLFPDEEREAPLTIFNAKKPVESTPLPKPVLTITLIVINCVVFAVTLAISTFAHAPWNFVLAGFGALVGPLVKKGAYATLLTSAFLHLGIVHLLVNMYALWVMGRVIEGLLGTARFGVVYFVSAITGSLLSLVFHPKVLSVGASGAIFGIGGAMLVVGLRHRDLVPGDLAKMLGKGAIPFFVYNLAFGLAIPGINVVAHIGGALGGAAAAWFLAPHKDTSRARTLASVGGISLVVLTFLAHFAWLVVMGMSMQRQKASRLGSPLQPRLARAPDHCGQYTHDALNMPPDCVSIGTSAAKLDGEKLDQRTVMAPRVGTPQAKPKSPADPHVAAALGLVKMGRDAEAEGEFRTAIRLDPRSAEPHFQLGLLLVNRERFREAEAEFRRGIACDPLAAGPHIGLGNLALLRGKTEGAIAEYQEAVRLEPDSLEARRILASAISLRGSPANP